MKLNPLRSALALFFIPVVCSFLISCKDAGGGARQPTNVINIGFDGGVGGGCIQPSFPADQPDLPAQSPPIFLLTGIAVQSTVGQAQASPGAPIEAEVTVNRATRRVKVELVNTSTPSDVVFVDEVETPGNEVISLLLETDPGTRGRFFMRLTLCGLDCDARSVVFDLAQCSDEPDARPCGVNEPYDRTLIENGEVIQIDGTCVDLGTTPRVGSGTILIQ